MKAVLISIQPKWCARIASGENTIEVRKRRPKLETPFKCYIYCTKSKKHFLQSKDNMFFYCEESDFIGKHGAGLYQRLNGKVIGEFVCDKNYPISCYYSDTKDRRIHREQPYTCLTDKEMIDYLGNGVEGYGWHISDLKIYEKPKELSEFYRLDPTYFNSFGWAFDEWEKRIPITRPPQSWCYVEELQE